MKKKITTLLFIMTFVTGSALFSNEVINGRYNRYYSFLFLTGRADRPTLNYKSYSANTWTPNTDAHPWARRDPARELTTGKGWSLVLPDPELTTNGNTGYPRSYHDGAAWRGRGFNLSAAAGIAFRSRFFDATLYPSFWFAQNAPYAILPPDTAQPDPVYGAFNGNLDYPQRFGDKPIFGFDFGQTDLRFRAATFTLGVSTEEIWLGPSRYNALILGNEAGGFPHIDIGIERTPSVIGDFEFRWVWGFLEESDFYTPTTTDDWRMTSFMSGSYAPSFIPGFTFGFQWAATTPGGEFDWRDLFIIPATIFGVHESNLTNNDNQLMSFTGSWAFPKVGFEVYGEWAREDFSWNVFLTPEHLTFWTVGFSQAFRWGDTRGFFLTGEFSYLMVTHDQILITGWPTANYYNHGYVLHGHTLRGQMLGAGVGPGGDGQYLEFTFYDKWGSAGVFLSRIARDKMYTHEIDDYHRFSAEFTGGLNGSVFLGKFDLFGEILFSYTENFNYVLDQGAFNFGVTLGVAYHH